MAEPVLFHDVTVVRETDRALLLKTADWEEWVPKSQIVEDESDVSVEGDKGTVALTQWIVDEKGLT